jgi:hypothetical protein
MGVESSEIQGALRAVVPCCARREDDEEIAFGGGVQLRASGLDRRGLKHASFTGLTITACWTTSMRRCLASWLGSMS